MSKEVDDEVRFHLERKVAALVAEGMSREEAEREARRRFGDVERVKEEMRTMTREREERMRTGGRWDTMRQDVRYAVRQLLKNPVFTVVTVLTLALGIGLNTAIFSVVDGILFKPLPFPEPGELVNVWTDVTRRGGPDDEWLSYANYHDLREESRTLEALAVWGGQRPTWTDPEQPEQLLAARVAEGMFSRVLRVEPTVGRGFRPADHEPGAPPVALLSHGFWEQAFGSDRSVVGQTLVLNDRSVEVIGVMPSGFRPPFIPNAELWMPAAVDPARVQNRRGGFSWRVMGRLAERSTVEGARAELRRLGARLEAEYPEHNTDMTFTAVALRDDLVGPAKTGLLVLLGAVGFVLLVACVNVANLLLARASARESELAVRSAVGAGGGRLAKQLLTESLTLAVVGGGVGVLVAFLGTDALVAMAPDGTPRLDEVAVNGRVLAFTAAITMAAGLAFGIVPALRAARVDLHDALRERGRDRLGVGGARLRSGLVVGQVALALILLVGAGLLVRSFRNLRTADLGFRPADVITVRVNLPGSRYAERPTRVAFVRSLEERLARLTNVGSVGVSETLPLAGFDGDATFHVEGRPLQEPGHQDAAWIRSVTPGYFGTMEIELIQGRNFTDADGEDDAEVLIINQTLASRFFPDQNPVGERITFSDPMSPDAVWREIVGVARDVRNFGIREGSRFAVYLPWAQVPRFSVFAVLRTTAPPEKVIPAVRAEVADLDPDLAVAQVRTMEEIVRAEVAPERFVAFLLSMFAAVGLLLAAVGLYGVVAYGVSTRVREMGVRMALGAGGARILRMVIGRSLVLVIGGMLGGTLGAFLLTRLMSNLLFEVTPTDPWTFVVGTVLLVTVASVAAAVPALRATRIDPASALRSE